MYIDSDKDAKYIEPLEEEAEVELLDPEYCEVSWIRMGYQPKWFSDIQKNNWVIDCTRSGKRTREIGSPARVIRKHRYTTKSGKTYHMLMLERPVGREEMPLTEFRTLARKRFAPGGVLPPKRSQAISSEMLADLVMRFWTARGKVFEEV